MNYKNIFGNIKRSVFEIDSELSILKKEIAELTDKINTQCLTFCEKIMREDYIIERAQKKITYSQFEDAKEKLHKIKNENKKAQESILSQYDESLETVVLAKYRPALLITKKNGDYELKNMSSRLGSISEENEKNWNDILEDWKERGLFYIAEQTGRVDLSENSFVHFPFVGTGFLIAKNYAITNQHVIRQMKCWKENNKVKWHQGVDPYINFDAIDFDIQENASKPNTYFATIEHFPEQTERDCALIKLEQTAKSPLEIHWNPISQKDLKGRLVCIIGHPGRDKTEGLLNKYNMELVFGKVRKRKSGFKHIMLGRLHDSVPLTTVKGWPTLQHDCSTLEGTSGSCLIDLGPVQPGNGQSTESIGKVIGLNWGGATARQNYALPMWQLPEIFKMG